MTPRSQGKLVLVGAILTDLAANPKLDPEVREAIREGIESDAQYTPHRSCPCLRCHQYFRTLDR